MQIFAAAWRTSGGGTTLQPMASLYATAAVRPRLTEVSCYNTTSNRTINIALRRMTARGTPGALITSVPQSDTSGTSVATPYDTHSANATLALGNLRIWTLPPYDGIIWTFQPPGMVIPASANAGIGLIINSRTGYVCDVGFTWIE